MFEAQSLWALLAIIRMHRPMRKAVEGTVEGFLGIRLSVDWRERRLRSISLWKDLQSLYGMGSVREHVEASRLPAQLGVRTSCGVFKYAGDWRTVLFGPGWSSSSPLAV
jgi:hypothetical protein